MKLFTQMKEEAGRFTGETAHRSKGKVGGNQEVGDVGGVYLASDSGVVAGRASVLENGPSIGGKPDEAKDSRVQGGIGCAVVVQGQKVFGESGDCGEVKGGGWSVADSNDCGWEEGTGGNEIVVWGGWVGRRAKGTDVDDGPLKRAPAAIFSHLVGRVRKDARDGTWATPGNDVVGFPSGA
jgi:hypothetical protein